jgi:aminoglycoside 6-adenylyltransferase
LGSTEVDVINRLVRWAEEQAQVRAMLLTSTRARPDAVLDRLSDYDVIVVVADVGPFVTDDAWVRWYGPPLVMFRDAFREDDIATYTRMVIYEDGTKIDYSIWPLEILEKVRGQCRLPDELDAGYRVLADKDGRTAGFPAPTYTAYIPRKPTEAEFLALIEEFWWETSYVAKNLWRDEIFNARYSGEVVMRFELLRPMLEWYIETLHDWSLRPGLLGKGFTKLLPPEIWARVEGTFAGANVEENWTALFAMCDLFRTVALAVADDLGYTYPPELDRRMSEYLRGIRALPPPASAARAAEVQRIIRQATQWAAARPDIRAVLLVGSWARGAAQPDSDVDLVVLTTAPESYPPDGAWTRELGAVGVSRVKQWGPVAERRLVLPSGLEVEVGIGPLSWAKTDPLDAGTCEVVRDGSRILHDPDGRMLRLLAACAWKGTPDGPL